MTEIALLLGVAAAAYGAARVLGLPAVPLLVVAGTGAAAVGWLDAPGVRDVIFLSLTVLLFSAGTELSPERVGRHGPTALRVGLLQFVALGGAGLAAALLMGYGGAVALHLAVATAVSSTLVGIRLLQRRRALFEPFGRVVAGVLLIQDVLVVLALPLLGSLRGDGGSALGPLLATLALGVGAYALSRWLPSLVGPRIEADREAALLGFLALLFVFVAVGGTAGVPPVSAAFLAGFALSGFPVSTVARGQLESLTTFFGALFFTALGAFLVVPSAADLARGLALGLLVVAVTPVVVGLAAERAGMSARSALSAGLLLAQTSELSLVVGLQGAVAGILEPEAFTVIAVATVVTMALTPLLTQEAVVSVLVRLHPFRAPRGGGTPPEDHVVLLGCGSNGRAVLDLLVTAAAPVAVVEEDPAVVRGLREAGIPAVRGDARDPEALEAAAIGRARAVVSTLPRAEAAEVALAAAPDIPVMVRVFEAEEEAWVRARGGTPVSHAEAAADDFFRWFGEEGPGLSSRTAPPSTPGPAPPGA